METKELRIFVVYGGLKNKNYAKKQQGDTVQVYC